MSLYQHIIQENDIQELTDFIQLSYIKSFQTYCIAVYYITCTLTNISCGNSNMIFMCIGLWLCSYIVVNGAVCR